MLPGLPSVPLDSTFGVAVVCVNITHNNDYQLTVQLVAPDGTTVDLSMNNGGGGNNYSNTCFTGHTAYPIFGASAPFSGTFRSQGILGTVNNGQQGNGTWQLKVQDHNLGSVGSVTWWSITFSSNPAPPFKFTSSNLPIVVINTAGQTIPDDPKIFVHMGIIDNGPGNRNHITDPFNDYDGNIAIELRGSWSQTFPQKQYGFETLDSLNVETDASILGMPAESDWVLNAPYNDKTCMRNVLVYDIANKTGHYASRTRYCELVLNNDYKGIYVMMEKVKRDANRVDISKLTVNDTTGNDVTGGYIFKLDKNTGSGGAGWLSQYDGFPGTPVEFQYEYPSDVDIRPQQAVYIHSFVDSFENALHAAWFLSPDSGYRKYIDVQSFVDYFILNEACRNVDAYRISTFLYKQKITKGGKLCAGPAWDYNIAFWNADYCEGNIANGWQYQFNSFCGTAGGDNVPFWWEKFLQDTLYTAQLRCRWNQLRGSVLNTDTLMASIDAQAAMLDEAKDRHFNAWPIMGIAVWANPQPVATSYSGEIASMKNWIQQRMTWLDANMPGTCILSGLQNPDKLADHVQVFPNPFHNRITVKLKKAVAGPLYISIEDLVGRTVYENTSVADNSSNQEIVIQKILTPGVYLLRVRNGKDGFNKKIIAH
jgi:subtilisin-like proprotein convertase family protein/spore coat protein CotH